MKNKTKYLIGILFMLAFLLLIGATNVNAVVAGKVYDVDLGTVNVGYTDSITKDIMIENSGTEEWNIMSVEVDNTDVFAINGTSIDFVQPGGGICTAYSVSAKTGLPAGIYTGKITLTTWGFNTYTGNVTLKVVDPEAQNNVLVTNAAEFINATNKTNAEDSADVIKLQNDIDMASNEINWNIYKDVTLDLNGNTLTLNDDKSINLIYHDNATLKIIDSSASKTGKIYKNDNNSNNTFTIKENDSNIKHNIEILVDGIKIENDKNRGHIFNGQSDYKLTIKDTTFIGSSSIIWNEENVNIDLNIETMQLSAIPKNGEEIDIYRTAYIMAYSNLKIDDVISEDSELLYYLPDETDLSKYAQVVADRETSLGDDVLAFWHNQTDNGDIIVRKKTGFDVTNINLDETYGYTSSTDIKEISIYNRGVTDLQIKNVSVDSANFQIENGNQAILSASETDTSWKIKAKEGLPVGTYTANITVTDINDNTYTTTVTLTVNKKEITDHNISMESWTYGETEKNYVVDYGEYLTKNDVRIEYANADSDSWTGIIKPRSVGKYKVRLRVINENYIAEEKIANFEILVNHTEIKIVPKSNSWVYDGNEHKESNYDVYYNGAKLEDKILPIAINGVYVEARIKGTVKDVDDTETGNNIVDAYSIVNGSGCFDNIKVETGTLTITPITTPIIVTANSDTKEYDGTDLINNGYTYTDGVILTGDTITATITGSQKYVGTSDNVVSNVKVIRDTKDITSNYTFGTHTNGTLKVETVLQTVDVNKNLYVRVNETLTIAQIKELLNCNHTDYNIRFEGGNGGTFDSTTGFTAGASEGQVQLGAIVPAKDINGDGVNEYDETGTSFFINVVNKENIIISGFLNGEIFEYDGTQKTPTGRLVIQGNTVPEDEIEVLYKGTGATNYNSTIAPKNAGTYEVTYKVKDSNPDYVGSNTYTFTIKKAQIAKPDVSTKSLEYKGFDQGYNLIYNKNILEVKGTQSATDIGNYSFTISLKDKNNYEWKDGTNTDIVIDWSIVQGTPDFTVPTGLIGVKGYLLSSIELPTGFTWNNDREILNPGTHTYKATYTPEDITNYKTITDIDITVLVKDKFVLGGIVNGGHGTISVSTLEVLEGDKAEVTFIPDDGYMIDKVLVNQTKVEVTGNKIELTIKEHTLVEVTYKKIPFTVIVEDVEGATVEPSGAVAVNYGDNKDFKIIANTGYKLIKVLVNDVEKKLDGNTLKLTNITSNMNIKVVVEKIVYEVIEGANQRYTITENTEARFRINADYSLFDGKVYVDNILVDNVNYTSESGSTIITFNKSYVDTLSVGEHTLRVAFTDGGEATTTFTIAKKAEENNNNDNTPSKTENEEKNDNILNPKTDDNVMIYVVIASMSVLGLGAITMVVNKKK